MRLFATSDLHTDYKDNFRWLAGISDRDYRDDALIVAGDISDRLPIIRQMEKRAIGDQAYQFPLLWWQRMIPHNSRLKGWKIGPSHYVNQDLRDVWLGQ